LTLALQLVSIALVPKNKKLLMALNHLNKISYYIIVSYESSKPYRLSDRRPTDGAGRRPCEVWRTLLILIGEVDL